MDTQDVSDPQQRRDTGVAGTGLNVLIGIAGNAGGEVDAVLGAVLAQSLDADAVADGASAFEQPGVVIGEVGHPSTLGAR